MPADPGAEPVLNAVWASSARGRDTATGDLRAWARGLVTPFPRPDRTPTWETVEQTLCEGYVRERVRLQVFDQMPFHAYVLIPDSAGPHPGVLAVHGHGYGSRQICGMLPDGRTDPLEEDGHRHFAVQLVRRGLTVIAPDVVGFGERTNERDRRFDPDASTACYRLASTLLLHGRTLSGLRVSELIGVLDRLGGHPALRPGGIGIVGHSGGSQLSLLTALVDDRIAAVVLCSWTNTFGASIATVQHCLCNYLPGMLTHTEQPDLIAALAPTPLFVESGTADPIFPAPGFTRAVQRLEHAWPPEAFGHDLHPGGHEVSGRRSFGWLARMMGA